VPNVEVPDLPAQPRGRTLGELLQRKGSGNEVSNKVDPDKRLGKDQQRQQQQQKEAPAVINAADHEQAPQPETKKIARKAVAKPVANKAVVAKKAGRKKPETEAGCPSSKTNEDFERELNLLRSQPKPQKKTKEPKPKKPEPTTGAMQAFDMYSSVISAGERDVKKGMFCSFYREQYAKIPTLDISQYGDQDASSGLSIKDGHRPMPRPRGVIDLPPDHKQPLGTISVSELAKYGCESKRMLICVHGDLFDVSDRPDKYSKDGPYWAMVGHDISWGFVCGVDDSSSYDQYYDIFKIQPEENMDRRLQGLMSWWCFYEKEYGDPVGRLDVYEEEWKLPQPPEVGDVCSVM